MPELSVVVVDDELPARRKLATLLAGREDFTVVGEAGDGFDAIRVIELARPALVLLDIRMPELDGFAVLDALAIEPWPAVIFVTAYDDFAVKAFEVGALDYLLKPITRERLDVALGRARHRLADPHAEEARVRQALEAATGDTPLERFLIRSLDKLRVVPVDQVRWIEAAGNYVKLHTEGGVHLVRGALQTVERRLDPARFVRIHRTTIVALDHVRHFAPAGHGDYRAILRSGEEVTLSRRYRDRLPASLIPR